MPKIQFRECRKAGLVRQSQTHDLYNLTQIDFHIINREIRILVKFSISDSILELTIDTGASLSVLKPNKLHGKTRISNNDRTTIIGISNDTELITMGRTFPQMMINNCLFSHPFHVIEDNINMDCDGILGNDFLIKYGASINYANNLIQFYLPPSETPYVRDPMFCDLPQFREIPNNENRTLTNGIEKKGWGGSDNRPYSIPGNGS